MMRRLFLLTLLLTLTLYPKVRCVVSIPPLQTFVEAIGDGEVESTVMVPPGHSPHSYEPKPSQMRALGDADCYFAVGVEFEKAWLPRFRAQNPKMRIVDLSEGLKKFPVAGHHGEAHGGETLDPHVWTSPAYVEKMAGRIYETLAALDPKHQKLYEKNYHTFLDRIRQTDEAIRKTLAPLPPHSRFMVFHPAWGYFAREYGLEQLPVEVEGKAPKPRQLMKLIDEAKRLKVRAIFVQPEFSDKSAKLLAAELGIPVVRVSPMAADWSDNLLRLARAVAQGASR
jgi:zinc transport system substrate-binding protein